MEDLVQLLKKKYMIEQRIRSVKTIQNESSKDSAKQLLFKLNEQLEKVKTRIAEEEGYLNPTTYSQKPDHEVQMARAQLYRAAKKAAMLHKVLQELPEENGLEGWVQAKITKASDYLDAVWAYLSYEMRFPYDESVEEAVAAYGPGEDPNAQQTTAPAKPGQTSPTPPAGGATPTAAGTGMVKMSKLDPNKKPIGTPIMVKNTDIPSKQKQGFFVIGENASAGASSAGGIAASPTGFASGGIGMQKRKKKVGEGNRSVNVSTPTDRAFIASRFGHDPDRAATIYKANKYDPDTGLGGYVAPRGDRTDQSNIMIQLRKNLDSVKAQPLEFKDGSTLEIRPSIARAALAKIENMRPVEKHEMIKHIMTSKDAFINFVKNQDEGKYTSTKKESVDEGFGDKIKRGVKSIKRGLQGWGDAGADYNEPHKNKPKDVVRRAKQLAKDDPEFAKKVAAGKTSKGSPGDLQRRVVTKALKTEEGTMSDAEKHEGGPKFTGYYKGTDKGRPGKKLVGSD